MNIESQLEEHLRDEAMVRYIIKWAAIVVCILFTVMVGCEMHSNTFDGERGLAEAKQRQADAEYKKVQNQVELEEIAVIERLIDKGTDPIKARCAIKGFDSRGNTVCSIAAGK